MQVKTEKNREKKRLHLSSEADGLCRDMFMGLFKKLYRKVMRPSVWARPEMQVTFRAEIMPGKTRQERTFRIKEVLPNGRVTLYNVLGEYRQSSFEPLNFKREKS